MKTLKRLINVLLNSYTQPCLFIATLDLGLRHKLVVTEKVIHRSR